MPLGAVWGMLSTPFISNHCRGWEAATKGIFILSFMFRNYNALIFPKELLLIDDLTNFEKILLAFLIDMQYSRQYNQIDTIYLTSSIGKPFKKILKCFNSLERKNYFTYALTSEYKENKARNILIDFSVNLEKIYNQ